MPARLEEIPVFADGSATQSVRPDFLKRRTDDDTYMH